MRIRQEMLQINIAPTDGDGYMAVTISSLKATSDAESLTILLRDQGACYMAIESINHLMDSKNLPALRILRDTLFALNLEETETCLM